MVVVGWMRRCWLDVVVLVGCGVVLLGVVAMSFAFDGLQRIAAGNREG